MRLDEVGAYVLLLIEAWLEDCSLPNDLDEIRAMLGRDAEDEQTWKRLQKFVVERMFTPSEDGASLYNENQVEIYQEIIRKRDKQAIGGRKGAAIRWGKGSDSQPIGKPWGTHDEPNGIQSQSQSQKQPPPACARNGEYSAEFLEFWAVYPRKIGKGAAWKAWTKLGKKRPGTPDLIKAVEAQRKTEQWRKDGGQYVPNPSTWLNQRRWEDEVATTSTRPRERPVVESGFWVCEEGTTRRVPVWVRKGTTAEQARQWAEHVRDEQKEKYGGTWTIEQEAKAS